MSNRNNSKGGSGDTGFVSPSEKNQSKIKGLDNGILNRRGDVDPCRGANYGTRANLDFPSMVARGENASNSQFSSVTPNGVQKQGTGEDRNSNYRWGDGNSGNRWNKNRDFDGDMSGN